MMKILGREIAFFFLTLPLVMYVGSIASFVVGYHITALPFVLAIVAGLAVLNRRDIAPRTKIVSSVVALAGLALTMAVAAFLYDYSCDGQNYHAATIKLLEGGWNPFYMPDISALQSYGISGGLWTAHYARAMEITEACVVALTGNLESGKAVNLWLWIALAGLCWDFLGTFERLRNGGTRILLTAVCAGNPVVINQLMTYYIDYACYTCILIGLICIYQLCVRRKKGFMGPLLLLGFFVPGIKFNIAFWFVFILLAFALLVYGLTKVFPGKLIRNMTVAVAAGFAVGGFNPYVTNLISHGNPLYPLMGEGKVDIMSNQIPESISGKTRIRQVVVSLVANPNNERRQEHEVRFDMLSKHELIANGMVDTRLGGFGIFFFEALCLLVLTFAFMDRNRVWKAVLASVLFLFLCLFLLPSGWWARYVPFFYIVVCLLAGYILCASNARAQRAGAYVATFLLLVDSLCSLSVISAFCLDQKMTEDYIVEQVGRNREEQIYVNTESVLLCDKLERTGADIVFNRKHVSAGYSFVLINLSVKVSLGVDAFPEDAMPWLMRKVGIFRLKGEPVEDEE